MSRAFSTGVGGWNGEPRSLVAEFDRNLDQQDFLCRGLEGMADSLPGRLNPHQAVGEMRRMRLVLRRAHLLEETLVFPALIAAHPDLGPVLNRLCAEHAEDEDHASELVEAVAAFRVSSDAERLGYMMRGLFVGLRRHAAFERDHVRPLLRGSEQGRQRAAGL